MLSQSPFSSSQFPILKAASSPPIFDPHVFSIIAGPCAIESQNQIEEIAHALSIRGIKWLRGGAYKPRTSPMDFQGLGQKGLEWISKAAKDTKMRVITEVMAVEQVAEVSAFADILQVGARNMYNSPLLKALGRQEKPVLLKRGFQATLSELLHAAEYIIGEGNRQVILCERGIRSFDQTTRNVMDLGGASLLKQYSGLQVIADPSHASGRKDLITPLTLASKAIGLDGVMIEISLSPEKALCDGHQALSLQDLDQILNHIQRGEITYEANKII